MTTPKALGVDGGGRIVVAGSASGQAFVAVLSAAGTLDPAFGNGGVVLSSLGGTTARLSAVQWTSAGTVLAGGTVTAASGSSDGVIVQFRADGLEGPGFGTGGRVVVDLGSASDHVGAMVQPWTADTGRGNLRLVGDDGADMVTASVRFDGAPVFGPGNFDRHIIDFGTPTSERARGMALLPDGRIIVAGSGSRGMILVRLLPDGSPDPTFGSGGVILTRVSAWVSGVALVQALPRRRPPERHSRRVRHPRFHRRRCTR